MADLSDFEVTDLVDDVLAATFNKILATALRAEYANTETISATRELADSDTQFQILTASGSDQDVELAPEATSNHVTVIYNPAGTTYDLVVKDDSGTTTYATLDAGEWALCVPMGGSVWKVTSSTPESSTPETGWEICSAVIPTRASADDPTYVLTFAGVDLTGLISVGMKIKWTQDGTVRYGFVTAISFSTNTTLTLYGGTDYNVEDTATYTISAFAYSTHKAPFGFPLDDAKWTVSLSHIVNSNVATPSSGTWYGGAGLSDAGPSLSVPIGLWKGYYKCMVATFDTTVTDYNVYATLSNANNTESDTDNTSAVVLTTPSGSYKTWNTPAIPVRISLAAKTTYYINIKTSTATADAIYIRGDVIPSIIKLVCGYL